MAGAATVPPGQPPILGVNIPTFDRNEKRLLQDIPAAAGIGARWVRVDRRVKVKRNGDLYLAHFSEQIRNARKHGARPLVILGRLGFVCSRRRRGRIPCPPTPRNFDLYAGYLRRVVKSARGDVTTWESWNEPNHRYFFYPYPSPKRYAQILKLQYRVIKRADPNATLLFAPMAGTDLLFTRQVLDALHGAPVFDGVAVHPYRVPSPGLNDRNPVLVSDGSVSQLTFKEEVLATEDLFSRYGYGRPDMWITEFGRGAKDEVGQGEQLLTFSAQAAYLRQTYTLLHDDPDLDFVKAFFWFNLRDYDLGAVRNPDDPFFNSFAFSGLLTTDFTRKPAANAFEQLARGG